MGVKLFSSCAGFAAAMMLSSVSLSCAADLLEPAPLAEASSPWFIRLGAAGVFFDSSASLKLAAQPVPGASAVADDNYTAMFEVGWYLNKNISFSITGGYPPTSSLHGVGTAAPFGVIGEATYGPAVLAAQYHFTDFGNFQPYVGGGLTYAIIFNSIDGAVTGLKVTGAPGLAVHAGFDYMIDRHWGLFVDVKKLWLTVDAAGSLLGLPVTADVKLDPVVASTGVTYRF
ncbi:OmpW/AlkL family protein [Xanthobacter versatilis]|uniref:OmpW/AlkL family protein n=1 Tax=Xanthobacter autotrophicus (strain ATCC BAA-1158 / Py2) TaxID=78245 RepID=UPI003726B875